MEIVLEIVGAIILAVYLYNLNENRGLVNLIEGTPTTPIGSIKGGLTEIKGKIVPCEKTITSPLSRKAAVYLHLIIRQCGLKKSGSRNQWIEHKNMRKGGRFYVDDGSGRALVSLHRAKLELEVDNHRSSGPLSDTPEDFERCLKGFGLSSKGLVFNNDFTCEETILEEGDEMYILGEPTKRGDVYCFDGSFGEMFFVSDKSERKLTEEIRSQMMIETLICFSALGGIAAYIIFA